MTSKWPFATNLYDGQPGHSTYHNNVQHALNFLGLGRFFVEDYGAVGDGLTDDGAAINAATAAAAAAGGGVVIFRPGKTYLTSVTIRVASSNISLLGVGATLKAKAASAQDNIVHFYGTDAVRISNVSIIGLWVYANYDNAGGTQPRGVKFEYTTFGYAENVTVQNPYVGLDFDKGCAHCTAHMCRVYDFTQDGFDSCGTLAATDALKPYDISFIECAAYAGQVTQDHAIEIEDGTYDVSVIGFWTDGKVGIRNHDITYAGTHSITFLNCIATEYEISDDYHSATNYIQDIIMYDCEGTITDDKTIVGLTVLGRNEFLLPNALKTVTISEPADGTLRNGECALWYDQSGPVLNVKAKQNDGTVVTGSVALSV